MWRTCGIRQTCYACTTSGRHKSLAGATKVGAEDLHPSSSNWGSAAAGVAGPALREAVKKRPEWPGPPSEAAKRQLTGLL